MNRIIYLLILFIFAFTACKRGAQKQTSTVPQRPKILGVAHAAFYTKDLDNSRQFFKDFLGYAEPVVLTNDDGGIALTIIKINDRQFVELFPERREGTNRLYHFAIETDDAEAMRLYLEHKGYKVPETTKKGRVGNSNYFVTDPNGTICEIVQYEPDGMTVKNFGLDMPNTRISTRMSHVGFMVPDLDKALEFYVDVLGFYEVWRGGRDPEKVTWVHLKTPEGNETIELMLYEDEPSWARMGSMNHICLEVKDVFEVEKILAQRTPPLGIREPSQPSVGVNKKRQINYYLIDGTRVEIMEDDTIDGIPAPSSTGTPLKYVKTE